MILIKDGRAFFWQWDTQRTLIIRDEDGVETLAIHILLSTGKAGIMAVQTDEETGERYIKVPQQFFEDGSTQLTVYDYKKDSAGNYTTEKKTFPIMARPKPEVYEPSEDVMLTWDTILAIAKKWANGTDVTEKDEQYHNNAKYYAEQAGEAATSAAESSESAFESAGSAESDAYVATQKAEEASGSATSAASSAKTATDKASEAGKSASSAEADAKEASESASTAETAMEESVKAKDEAVSARNGAVTAKQSAEESQSSATQSASDARESASSAESSASVATEKAKESSESASSAKTSAKNAGTYADNAEQSANTAEQAKNTAVSEVEGFEATVESAKTEAVNAIETAGSEVLESIPDDYSQTSAYTETLRENTVEVEEGLSDVPIQSADFEEVNTDTLFIGKTQEALKPVLSIALDAPSSSSSDGKVGQMYMDSQYLYVCIDDNSWKRTALSDF